MPHEIAFIILAKNEEQNLHQCLESLRTLSADVFVIDSGSTDRTTQVASAFGATVLSHPFKNYSDQMNWAIDHINTDAPWLFRLDADEYLTPELAQELRTKLGEIPNSVTGLEIKRRFLFMGRWIKHGGMYPLWHLRIWRNGHARCEERWMDEHMRLVNGETLKLGGDIVDRNNKDLSFWINKHNWYASREVLDMESSAAQPGSHNVLDGQASRKRWAKESLYTRAPLFLRAGAYWFLRYVLLRGFRDGKEGLIFHCLQAFWYRFLVDAKIYERMRSQQQHEVCS